MATKINTLDELKTLAAEDGGAECFVALAGGLMRSSKHFWYDAESAERWNILHEIDDTETAYPDDVTFLNAESNIAEALRVGALYAY
jgi:hypothetical protein